jgi:hypothetical protein
MAEPWDRRKQLEDLTAGLDPTRVAIVPVTENAAHVGAFWVGQGGEGIVLKERRAHHSCTRSAVAGHAPSEARCLCQRSSCVPPRRMADRRGHGCQRITSAMTLNAFPGDGAPS